MERNGAERNRKGIIASKGGIQSPQQSNQWISNHAFLRPLREMRWGGQWEGITVHTEQTHDRSGLNPQQSGEKRGRDRREEGERKG